MLEERERCLLFPVLATMYCTAQVIFSEWFASCRCACLYCVGQVSFSEWFTSHGGTRESLTRLWDPIAYALGFIDCDHISARCMLTIFAFFATKTKASVLRMLCGSPDKFLSGPIKDYIEAKGGR